MDGAPLPPPPPLLLPVALARHRRTLSASWSWTLASGWAMVMACIGLVANTGQLLGGPPFWLPLVVPPFVMPGLVLAALAVDWRHSWRLSWVAVGVLAALAVVDVL